MSRHAPAVGCRAFSFSKITMVPLVGPLEFVFCFGGWTASCVALFHLIVSIYGTEMTQHKCSCKGMTAEEAAAVRTVETYMGLCGAVQMAAAAVSMTAKGRVARRASKYVALSVAAATMWLWCVYLYFLPQLLCFRCFGVLTQVAVVSMTVSLSTPALVMIPRALVDVVRGDDQEWDD